MELFVKILSGIAQSAPLVIAAIILRKPLMKLKKISVEKLEIETIEDEHV